MTHAKEKIQAMDDFQVVRFFEAFAQQLAVGTQTPFDAIKGSIPPSIKSLAGWEGIEGLSPERAAQVMEPTAAVETTHSPDAPGRRRDLRAACERLPGIVPRRRTGGRCHPYRRPGGNGPSDGSGDRIRGADR
jgi:hypothetical protein